MASFLFCISIYSNERSYSQQITFLYFFFKEFTAAFEIFTNESETGYLGPEELGKVMRMLAQDPTDEELEEIIRDNGSGWSNFFHDD